MRKSYITLHLAVLLAGFTGVFGKLITLNEGLLVWYRVFLATLMLFLLLRLLKIKVSMTLHEKWRIAKIGMFITIHWIFFYASIKYANISIGVVCYCLTSFFTAIFEPVINRKHLNVIQLLLSGLTLLGIILIFHFDMTYRLGIILGVISSSFAALYTIFNEKLVKFYDSAIINYYQMLGGTVGLGLLLPIYLFFFPVKNLVPNVSDMIYLILLASFCTVGLYILFAESLKRIPAFTVNLSFNLEPVYSIIMAFIFFNESRQVNMYFYLGLLLVMSSVIIQTFITYRSRSHSPKQQP